MKVFLLEMSIFFYNASLKNLSVTLTDTRNSCYHFYTIWTWCLVRLPNEFFLNEYNFFPFGFFRIWNIRLVLNTTARLFLNRRTFHKLVRAKYLLISDKKLLQSYLSYLTVGFFRPTEMKTHVNVLIFFLNNWRRKRMNANKWNLSVQTLRCEIL